MYSTFYTYAIALLHYTTVLMIITGACVNGPYAMITTAVSADLVRTIYVFTHIYHSETH